MATLTIKNVPAEIINEVWTTIEYSNNFKFLWKKRLSNDSHNNIEYWDDREIDNLWKSSLITSNSF